MSIDVLRHKVCFIIYYNCYILLFIACCPITDIYGGRGAFWFTARWRTGIVPTLITIYVCSDRILTCRIKSICSPAKGGTGCYRFNYQPGS